MKAGVSEQAIITTYTGRHIDLLSPEAMISLIHIDDIAWSLSGINRYNAHSRRLIPVAEHCLLGLPFVLPKNQLPFLMHDSPEAYLGDIVGPIKSTSIYAGYRALETRWWAAIATRYGLPAVLPKEIDLIDKRMRYTEQRDLMGRRPASTDAHLPFTMSIPAIAPSREDLAHRFVRTFNGLVKGTVGAKR